MDVTDLHGTWELERFWFIDDAGVETDPLGADPVGNLILGPDGFYAFTMMRRGRAAYASGDLLRGTSAETAEAAHGYVSFGGTWRFDGDGILFDIAYSLFPNWLGGTQKRLATIDGGKLLLRTTGPIPLAGKVHRGAARWHRA
jgi:hypothetical protein